MVGKEGKLKVLLHKIGVNKKEPKSKKKDKNEQED